MLFYFFNYNSNYGKKMVSRHKEWYVSNAVAIAAAAQSFPLAETGGPTDLDRREDFPLKNFKVENKSGVAITLLLDPVGPDSTLKFTIPNGQTLTSETQDNFKFSNMAIINNGAIEMAIGTLTVNMRNY